MERFFDGTDQENSKTQGGKGQIRKIQKNKKKKKNGEKKKKRFLHMHAKGTIHVGSPLVGNALGLPPSCDPPS
jgi:hypothetical protein